MTIHRFGEGAPQQKMYELLGGDVLAARVTLSLMRAGAVLVQDVLRASHDDLADLRGVGVRGALRLGELRGSMRPGMRGQVEATAPLLEDVYKLFQDKVRSGELASCASLGTHQGMPPEIHATIKRGERRYTLVLTPTEESTVTETPCAAHDVCTTPVHCLHGCRQAADELTGLGQEMGLQ